MRLGLARKLASWPGGSSKAASIAGVVDRFDRTCPEEQVLGGELQGGGPGEADGEGAVAQAEADAVVEAEGGAVVRGDVEAPACAAVGAQLVGEQVHERQAEAAAAVGGVDDDVADVGELAHRLVIGVGDGGAGELVDAGGRALLAVPRGLGRERVTGAELGEEAGEGWEVLGGRGSGVQGHGGSSSSSR
jgi:hypothetical protein